MLYYEAMVSMVQKQQKIVDHQNTEQAPQIPSINEKSRQIAQGRTLKDLFQPKKSAENLAAAQSYSIRRQSKSPAQPPE